MADIFVKRRNAMIIFNLIVSAVILVYAIIMLFHSPVHLLDDMGLDCLSEGWRLLISTIFLSFCILLSIILGARSLRLLLKVRGK